MKGFIISSFVILLVFCVYESEASETSNEYDDPSNDNEYDSYKARQEELLISRSLRHINYRYPNLFKVKLIASDVKESFDSHVYEINLLVVYTNCLTYMEDENCTVLDYADTMSCFVKVNPEDGSSEINKYEVTCNRDIDVENVLELQAKILFIEFVKRYNVEYANDASELAYRFNIFRDNVKKLGLMNAEQEGTATFGVTTMSDRENDYNFGYLEELILNNKQKGDATFGVTTMSDRENV